MIGLTRVQWSCVESRAPLAFSYINTSEMTIQGTHCFGKACHCASHMRLDHFLLSGGTRKALAMVRILCCGIHRFFMSVDFTYGKLKWGVNN